MASGGEQAGWVVLGGAGIAAAGSIIDRLIGRYRPRQKHVNKPGGDAVAERAELAAEWQTFRTEVNRQLADCRTENDELRGQLEAERTSNFQLRREMLAVQLTVSTMRAAMVAAGLPVPPDEPRGS